MDEISEKEQKSSAPKSINYYVIAAIFISVLLFTFANAIEPQINAQLDFFELIFVLAYAAPAVFSFSVARKRWGSLVFGRAYLSLAIAYGLGAIGAALYDYYQMAGVDNPYPGIPDIFFFLYYIFAIIHLRINTRFGARLGAGGRLTRHQKMIIIIIPLAVTSIYAFGLLFAPAISVTDSVPDDKEVFNLVPIFLENTRFDPLPESDPSFWKGYFAGIYFVAATTAVFAWAIVGAQVFRRSSQLGTPWALLIIGLGLNAVGDVSYYFTSIYSYDRTNPIIGVWVLGFMIVCYALYLHEKRV